MCAPAAPASAAAEHSRIRNRARREEFLRCKSKNDRSLPFADTLRGIVHRRANHRKPNRTEKTTMNDALTPSEPWEQQPEEPNRWYARFERYRLAGPSRSL